MEIINEHVKDKMIKGYEYSDPFKFGIIDNFLNETYLNNTLKSIRKLDNTKADYKFFDPKWEKNKYGFQTNFDDNLTNIFKYLNSDEFINYLEQLTGIKELIRNETNLKGAGIHRIYNEGFLSIHSDFNYYESPEFGKLDRRINLLLYLNSDWKDEYNGHLLLCDRHKQQTCYKISPILNRCVIFNTTKNSLHGHPYPLNVPENKYRESIAVYYYTKNKDGIDFEGDKIRPTLIFYSKYDETNMISI